ncbi:MAG TPA: rod shape-determining protein [Chloroflexi bacterium]|nr:rod shape-determining protein [Chloroflexota bacterium]
MGLFSRDLGIDLGTKFTRIAFGDSVVVEEPTVVAIAIEEAKAVEIGQAADDMDGRVPDSIEVVRPLQNGVIADYEVTTILLEALLRRTRSGFSFVGPRVAISVPEGITSVERRAVHEAALEAGSREAFLVQQPLAAALGADLPIGTPSGNMLLSIGAGSTQAAVLAMYGIVTSETLRAGGYAMDEAIVSYARRKYGVIIGPRVAEQIKIGIGAAVPQETSDSVEVQGQDQVSGLPRPLSLTTDEVVEALQEPLAQIAETARRVLEKTPPELVSDIIDHGLALCGGGALLRGIDKLLTKELGIPAYLVEQPRHVVALGAAQVLTPSVYAVVRRNLPPS